VDNLAAAVQAAYQHPNSYLEVTQTKLQYTVGPASGIKETNEAAQSNNREVPA